MRESPSATRAAESEPSDLAHYPFRAQVHTRFTDLDPQRHVNNVAMGELFAEGRLLFHRELFARVERPANYKYVVAQANYRFLGETFYPATVDIGLAVTRIGRTSFSYAQGLFQQGRRTSLCDTTLVGRLDGEPTPLPEALIEILRVYSLPMPTGREEAE